VVDDRRSSVTLTVSRGAPDRTEGVVEVKIGVQHAAREITFESNAAPDELAAAISAAANDGTLLTLTDDKGRQILVPGDRIAYVEIGVVEGRRVGFGAI
jgi:hypothetical protein